MSMSGGGSLSRQRPHPGLPHSWGLLSTRSVRTVPVPRRCSWRDGRQPGLTVASWHRAPSGRRAPEDRPPPAAPCPGLLAPWWCLCSASRPTCTQHGPLATSPGPRPPFPHAWHQWLPECPGQQDAGTCVPGVAVQEASSHRTGSRASGWHKVAPGQQVRLPGETGWTQGRRPRARPEAAGAQGCGHRRRPSTGTWGQPGLSQRLGRGDAPPGLARPWRGQSRVPTAAGSLGVGCSGLDSLGPPLLLSRTKASCDLAPWQPGEAGSGLSLTAGGHESATPKSTEPSRSTAHPSQGPSGDTSVLEESCGFWNIPSSREVTP